MLFRSAYTEPFGAIRLEPIRLLAGRYPIAGERELALEQRMAERYGLRIGDTLVVRMQGISARAEAEWRVVGLVYQPYVYLGSSGPENNAYAAFDDARQITGFTGLSSIYLRFENFATARQQQREIRPYLNEQTPYQIVFTLTDDPEENIFIVGARRFSRILSILGVVALIVASFLVTNVISTILAEQRRQIGAMKALGATRRHIFTIYFGMAFVYGLLGTVPGVIAGVFIGQRAAVAAAPLANVILESTTPPLASIALGIALGIGVPVAAALVPILNGMRVTILEAMTDQGLQARYGRGLAARIVSLLPVGPIIRQALNSILQRWTRLALTGLSLTAAVAAFMGVFASFATLDRVVTGMRDTLDYDITANVQDLELLRIAQSIPAAEDEILEIGPGVAIKLMVDPAAEEPEASEGEPPAAPIAPDDDSIFVTGIDPATDLERIAAENGHPVPEMPPGSLLVTPGIASRFDKEPGDTLRLALGEKVADFEIAGIVEFPLETAFTDWEGLASFVGHVDTAPRPNEYWVQVEVDADNGDDLPAEPVWAVGIDEVIGNALAPGFDPEEPGVIISRAIADAGGLEVGDELTLQATNGARTYPILQILSITPAQVRIFARDVPADLAAQGEAAEIVALYWEELEALQGLDYRAANPEMFYLDLGAPTMTMTLTIPRYEPVAIHRNQLAVTDTIAQTIVSVGWVMGVAALMLALVGGIGLLTVTAIGVSERRREIGVMRSVGATSGAIMRQFLLEGVLVGVIAWLIGVPLSIVLNDFLIEAVPFREVIRADYPPFVPVLGLLAMLAITVLATLYPARQAARMTVAEILRYQ